MRICLLGYAFLQVRKVKNSFFFSLLFIHFKEQIVKKLSFGCFVVNTTKNFGKIRVLE